ncbi:MAG: hypothetical protein AB7G75_04620 [Candidatus Binatia bacterium]
MKYQHHKDNAGREQKQRFTGMIKPLPILSFSGVLDNRLPISLCGRYGLRKPQRIKRLPLAFHRERRQINVHLDLRSFFHREPGQSLALALQMRFPTLDGTASCFATHQLSSAKHREEEALLSSRVSQPVAAKNFRSTSQAPAFTFDSRNILEALARGSYLLLGFTDRLSHLRSAAVVPLQSSFHHLPVQTTPKVATFAHRSEASRTHNLRATSLRRSGRITIPIGQALAGDGQEHVAGGSLWPSQVTRVFEVNRRSIFTPSNPSAATLFRRDHSGSHEPSSQGGFAAQQHLQLLSQEFDAPQLLLVYSSAVREPLAFLARTIQNSHQTRWKRSTAPLMCTFRSLSLTFPVSARNLTDRETQDHPAVREVPQMQYVKPDNSLTSGLSQAVQSLQHTLKKAMAAPVVSTPQVDVNRLTRQVYDQFERELRIEKERRGL